MLILPHCALGAKRQWSRLSHTTLQSRRKIVTPCVQQESGNGTNEYTIRAASGVDKDFRLTGLGQTNEGDLPGDASETIGVGCSRSPSRSVSLALYGEEERIPFAALGPWDPGWKDPWYLTTEAPAHLKVGCSERN